MKCKENNNCTVFDIDYKKELVTFKEKIFNKKKMGLKEFALTVLQIEPVSVELVAMYIGKLGFDTYNKSEKFNVIFTKKTKKGIKGKIEIHEN